jgi:hypothetical protein
MTRKASVPTSVAAQRLGCSPRHVRNLFWNGLLEGFFIGTAKGNRGLRLYCDSLDRYQNQDPLSL